MFWQVLTGIMIPFFGTCIGSSFVFFGKRAMSELLGRILSAVAAGVMTAASIWSLIIPSIELSENMGKLSFLPAVIGFILGVLLLIWADKKVLKIYKKIDSNKFSDSKQRMIMQFLAVTLHNIPEGMAVGIVYAALLAGETHTSLSAALVLSLGIAIQNIPEGAIISMPLNAEGIGKGKAFLYSVFSGVVEPIGAVAAIWFSKSIGVLLPILLSLAAGAMIYVTVYQLIPSMYSDKHNNLITVLYSFGFLLMMSLDVALG